MNKKIIIDPGHYAKYNRSPVVSAYYEGDQVWKLALYLSAALKEYGFTVGMTKQTINGYPKNATGGDDVYKRGQMARGYDLMISLHSNACGTESVDRAVVIHPVSGKEKQLAEKLGAITRDTMCLSSYQLYTRKNDAGGDYYGVIRGAAAAGVPCIIIEHGFHTNTKTANWLLKDINLKKLADAEAKVISEYYGAADKPETDKSTGSLYRVQIGAYGKKENADAMLAKAKAAGFGGIIIKSGNLYRVQIGAYSQKSNADAMLKRLKAAGFSGFVLKS